MYVTIVQTRWNQEFERMHRKARVWRTLSKKEIKCPCSHVLQRWRMLTNIYSIQLYLLLSSTYTYLRSIYALKPDVASARIECNHIKRALATLKIALKSALINALHCATKTYTPLIFIEISDRNVHFVPLLGTLRPSLRSFQEAYQIRSIRLSAYGCSSISLSGHNWFINERCASFSWVQTLHIEVQIVHLYT